MNVLKSNSPVIKGFTVKELKEIKVPQFQRWIVNSNIKQLEDSINQAGMLRCPIVCHVKSEKVNYIIDGNHMRTIIVKNNHNNTVINCIYCEAVDYADAAEKFKLLNTKGKALDWVDLTNLYMHVHGSNSVYGDVWTIIGNPDNYFDIKKIKGFTLATIIEFLCNNKGKYRNGDMYKRLDIPKFSKRKSLLNYLLVHANTLWENVLDKHGLARPNGGAILGFQKVWFKDGYDQKYDEYEFLDIITDIFKTNSSAIKQRKISLNRDVAGTFLRSYMKTYTSKVVVQQVP
jgi:hypothetical protein